MFIVPVPFKPVRKFQDYIQRIVRHQDRVWESVMSNLIPCYLQNGSLEIGLVVRNYVPGTHNKKRLLFWSSPEKIENVCLPDRSIWMEPVVGHDFFFQFFPGKKYSALNGTKWQGQFISNLLIFKAFEVHQEGNPDAVI